MKVGDLQNNIRLMKSLIIIWFISLILSLIMFYLGVKITSAMVIVCASIIALISLLGLFYSGYLLIKMKNHLEYLKNKVDI